MRKVSGRGTPTSPQEVARAADTVVRSRYRDADACFGGDPVPGACDVLATTDLRVLPAGSATPRGHLVAVLPDASRLLAASAGRLLVGRADGALEVRATATGRVVLRVDRPRQGAATLTPTFLITVGGGPVSRLRLDGAASWASAPGGG